MKKLLALILTVSLLLGLVSVHAEEPAKYERLNVGTFTAFSGNFFSEALGNNISDLDVRRLIPDPFKRPAGLSFCYHLYPTSV